MKLAQARIPLGVALVGLSLANGPGPVLPANGPEPEQKPSPPRAAAALKVVNESGKEMSLSPEAPAKLPRQSVKVKDHRGNPATYEGVPLGEVLRSAGVTLGKDLRDPLLANYLLVEAADAYRVVFALPEVDPGMTDKVVLLADRRDGQPLNAEEGPYRLVVPEEKRGALGPASRPGQRPAGPHCGGEGKKRVLGVIRTDFIRLAATRRRARERSPSGRG